MLSFYATAVDQDIFIIFVLWEKLRRNSRMLLAVSRPSQKLLDVLP